MTNDKILMTGIKQRDFPSVEITIISFHSDQRRLMLFRISTVQNNFFYKFFHMKPDKNCQLSHVKKNYQGIAEEFWSVARSNN